MYAISDAIDDTTINMYGKVFGLENKEIDAEKQWTVYVIPALLVPVIVASGYLMMRFGRFVVIMGTLVVMAALSPILIFPDSYATYSAGFILHGTVLKAIVIGGLMIYAYETVPIKYRRVALISLSVFASLGRIAFAIGRYISGNLGYGSAEETDVIRSQYSIMLGVVCGTLILPIILGIVVRKDSPVSLVVRGFERQVYRYLVSWRCGDVSTAPPMNEDDFVYQVEVERERSYMDFKTMCVRKWPALLFLFLTGYAWQLIDIVFMTPYKYLVLDHFGGGYDLNPHYGLVIFNCCCLAGTLAAIVYILQCRSITILPGIAMGLLFVGACICAPVEPFYIDGGVGAGKGNPIEYQFLPMNQIIVGQIVMWIGYTLAQFLWGLLIVEIVPGTYRPVVVMAQMGFLEFTHMALRAIYIKYNWEGRGLYIACTVILGLIAVAYMIVFVGTNWFSRADPAEEDDGEIAIDVLDEEEVYLENGKGANLDSFMYASNSNGATAGGLSSARVAGF